MTEGEWLACSDPHLLLLQLSRTASDRKLRLFACACCRSIWQLLDHENTRRAVEVAEQFADRLVRDRARADARNAPGVWAVANYAAARNGGLVTSAASCAWHARIHVGNHCSDSRPPGTDLNVGIQAHFAGMEEEQQRQVALLRDVFGNPFRPVSVDPAWRTPTVLSLAQAGYDERELPSGALSSVRLNVLADALEESGCADAGILDHLRGHGPHVRGCWALDLILGKE